MRRPLVAATIAVLLSASSVPASARDKDPLNIENGALDEIHLKVATLPAGISVVLRPFSTAEADLGTGGDGAKNEKRSDAAATLVKTAPGILLESLEAALAEGGKLKVLSGEGVAAPESTIVMEGKFLKIDPGSKAKRYWASFGAGKSGVQVRGTVKDASGKILAEFTHMRGSGIGIGGGDYLKFLSDDARDIGRDLARFLTKWAAGADLHGH